MDKKAITGVMVAIIASLASFVALIGLYMTLQPDSDDYYLEACHLVLGAKKLEVDTIGNSLHLIDQNCLTTEFDVEAKRFKSKENISKYFADKMGLAWWAVHEGTIPETWDNEHLFSGSWFDQESCVILETIDYQGLPGDAPEVNVTFFKDYLLEEVYLKNHLGRNWKYQEYFQFYGQHVSGKPASRGLVSFLPGDITLVPGKTYAIGVSSMEENSKLGSAIYSLTKGATAAVVAGIVLAPLTGGLSLTMSVGVVVGGAALAGAVGTATGVAETEALNWLADLGEEKPRPTLLLLGEYETMQLAGCVSQTQLEK